MIAHVITNHGPASEVFALREVPDPEISSTQVLIAVEATSVNPLDCKLRQHSNLPRPFPMILGFDVCGVVTQIGSQVTHLQVGDRVYAAPDVFKAGANAELVAVEAVSCALVPPLPAEEAATVPLAGITAWEALFERLRIVEGDTLLIHGGAGGVGHLAIQLAKMIGCTVYTTAGRKESIRFCEEALGADETIHYREKDFAQVLLERTGGRGCAKILDTVGERTFEQSVSCLAVNGAICTILPVNTAAVGQWLLYKNATLHYEFMGASLSYRTDPTKQGVILQTLAQLIHERIIKPHVSALYDWKDLGKAHQALESGRSMGKIAVRVR